MEEQVSDTKNIVEALSKFQEEANSASKSSKNPFFKSTYASLEDIIETANKGSKYGLAFTQCVDFDKEVVDGKTSITMFVKTNLMHKASDTILTSRYPVVPKGNKYDDSQALGSAITYAKRYSLQAIYGIPSEDDDGNSNTHNPKVAPKKKEDNDKTKKITEFVNTMTKGIDAIMNDDSMTDDEKADMLTRQMESNKTKLDKLKTADQGQYNMLMDKFEQLDVKGKI